MRPLAWLLLGGAVVLGAIDDARVRRILASRQHRFPAAVVGIVDERGSRVVAQGSALSGVGVDGDSVFEIGSVTKAFTGILLAEMVERGEVSLDDPVAKFLPESVVMPSRPGKPITLGSLATQSSGLPRLPPNLRPADGANPYADFTVEQLYAALGQVKLTRDPFAQYDYSNFGMGLLGHALARRAGKSYFELLRERVLAPLGMNDTVMELSPGQRERLVPGYTAELRPAKNWDIPTLAGAGALRSTGNDLLKLLEAAVGKREAPATLRKAMERATQAMLPAGDGLEIGLAWHMVSRTGVRIVWHNGGTGGYRSWVGFDPEAKQAVVVLTNTAVSVDDVGLHLLHNGYRLVDHRPNSVRRELMQEEPALAQHVGRYQAGNGLVITVTLEDGRLHAQPAGQGKIRLYAEAVGRYFARDAEIQVEFVGDGMVVRTVGGVLQARKLP